MNYIERAAHCFRTDGKTIERFLNDFFSAPDFDSAMKVMNDFIDVHCADWEELNDFIYYVASNRSDKENTQ